MPFLLLLCLSSKCKHVDGFAALCAHTPCSHT